MCIFCIEITVFLFLPIWLQNSGVYYTSQCAICLYVQYSKRKESALKGSRSPFRRDAKSFNGLLLLTVYKFSLKNLDKTVYLSYNALMLSYMPFVLGLC